MSTLEDAKTYIDLPKNMRDEDALRFARAIITLYEIIDRLKGGPDSSLGLGTKLRKRREL